MTLVSPSAVELDNHLQTSAAPAAQDVITLSHDAHSHGRQEFSLPPTDSGKDAWLFLAACWAVEALVWGKCLLPPFVLGHG